MISIDKLICIGMSTMLILFWLTVYEIIPIKFALCSILTVPAIFAMYNIWRD